MDKLNNIVFFDDVCILCNSSVQLLIKLDRFNKLRFASLNSRISSKLRQQKNWPASHIDSIIFYYGGEFYIKSSAVFAICGLMPFPLKALRIFRFLPRFLTDAAYDIVAKYRYRVFDKRETCFIPSPQQRKKFLD